MEPVNGVRHTKNYLVGSYGIAAVAFISNLARQIELGVIYQKSIHGFALGSRG